MRVKYIGKMPYRTADKKFIPGKEYELSKQEIDANPGRFEPVQEKQSKPKPQDQTEV